MCQDKQVAKTQDKQAETVTEVVVTVSIFYNFVL